MEMHNRLLSHIFPVVLSFLFVFAFSLNSASAALNVGFDSINQGQPFLFGTFQQATNITLIQNCDDGSAICTTCNISSISDPSGNIIVKDVNMILDSDHSEFNYVLSPPLTNPIGQYLVTGTCTKSAPAAMITWDYAIKTDASASGGGNDVMFILFFILSYGLFVLAIVKKDWHLGMISGILLILFGIFVYNFGFNSQRNFMTSSIALITLALGAVTMLESALAMNEGL